MAAPWDGRLVTYLGYGLAADRPATPNIAPNILAFWYSTDTAEISLWDGAWVENFGVPGGGATNEILKKLSAADGDVAWGTLDFTDVSGLPVPTAGDGGKVVAVKPDGSGYEYVTGPVAAVTEYATATRWRIVTDAVGASGNVGWGEIGWLDDGGNSLGNTGTGVASSEQTGNEADKAFDFLYFTGNGWRAAPGDEATSWIEFEFTTAQSVRNFYVRPVYGYPTDAPEGFSVEYYDGASWVSLGSYTTSWPDSEYQTFVVGPIPVTPGAATLADGDYGDITVSSSGTAMTIDADTVTFAKMQNIATDRLLGRDTAASGDVEELTVGGGLEFTDAGGIQRGALTGDVTASAGSGVTTIPANTVTYAKMQDVSATSRVLGRKTAGAGDPEELTLSELLDFIGSAAQGDILYRGASGWARLGAGTSGYVLRTNGAGANPSWAAVGTVPGSTWFTGGTGDGSASTAAFAIKGCFFTPSVDLTITAVGALIDADASTERHVLGIASLSSVTFDANGGVTAATVGSVLATTGSGVYIGDTDSVAFEKALTASAALTAGSTYFIYIARTDGTGTSVCRANIGAWKLNAPGTTPVVANGRYSGATSLSGGETLDISTNNPPACMWITGTTT